MMYDGGPRLSAYETFIKLAKGNFMQYYRTHAQINAKIRNIEHWSQFQEHSKLAVKKERKNTVSQTF